MKKFVYVLFIFVFIFSAVREVNATSGALRKASIKTCNGVTYGQHSSSGKLHWHKAKADPDVSSGWIAVGEPIYSDPCKSSSKSSTGTGSNSKPSTSTTTPSSGTSSSKKPASSNSSSSSTKIEEIKKSSDASLNSVTIDKENIVIASEMKFNTQKEQVEIVVVPNDKKAVVKYEVPEKLNNGLNEVEVVVTAEDGTQKKYMILVTREVIVLDSNKKITIKLNGDVVEFEDYNARVTVVSDVENVNIDYILESNKTKVEIDGPKVLEYGNNTIKVLVTAEDLSVQEYIIVVYRNTKSDDFFSTVLGIGFIAGIVWCVKKFKKKK